MPRQNRTNLPQGDTPVANRVLLSIAVLVSMPALCAEFAGAHAKVLKRLSLMHLPQVL